MLRRRSLFPALWVALVLAGAVLTGGPLRADAPAPPPPSSGAESFLDGELLVRFKTEATPDLRVAALDRLDVQILDEYPLTGITRLRVPLGTVEETRHRLLAAGLVDLAEPNYSLRLAQVVPDDPQYATDQAWFYDLMGGPEAWAVTTGRPDVVVALIDGAVNLDHPDLASNIWTNLGEVPGNGLDDDGNGFVDDINGYDFIGDWQGSGSGRPGQDNDPDAKPGDSALGDGEDQDQDGVPDGAVGHGTQVAGIIAAVGNNQFGIAGAAWQVSIMALRVTSPEGDGLFSGLVAALEYAIANGADIVNISLAASVLPQSAQIAVEAAAAAGLILVGAAGNTGFDVTFPAALPDVIAVGSHDGDQAPDVRPLFSPIGPEVEFVAPGVDVLSTSVQALTGEPTFDTGTGTSFSAPFVTGAVVLIRALDPAASSDDVRRLLSDGAVDLPDAGAPGWDGSGRLHFGATLTALQAGAPAPPAITQALVAVTAIELEGTAAVGSAVAVSADPPGEQIATVQADATGHFTLRVLLQRFDDTVAQVALTAVATSAGGASRPSTPLTVALPRDVVLRPGWNLVSWAGPTGPGDVVLADLPPAARRVFARNGEAWELAVPGDPLFTIDEIRTGQGLWIFMGRTPPVPWRQFRALFQAPTLQPGWQLVVWAGPTTDPQTALTQTTAEIVAVYAWAEERQRFRAYISRSPLPPTLTELPHFEAVWVLVEGRGGPWPQG